MNYCKDYLQEQRVAKYVEAGCIAINQPLTLTGVVRYSGMHIHWAWLLFV